MKKARFVTVTVCKKQLGYCEEYKRFSHSMKRYYTQYEMSVFKILIIPYVIIERKPIIGNRHKCRPRCKIWFPSKLLYPNQTIRYTKL